MIKLKNLLLPILILACGFQSLGQTDKANLYFGLKTPGNSPEVFGTGLISMEDRNEFGSTFSKDGKEFFFAVDFDGRNEIYYSQLQNGEWSEPVVILKHKVYGYNDPILDPDEQRLYFISNHPVSGTEKNEDIDIWYVERQKNG
ncbi:MAG: hypothetical protein AAGC85_07620, partial [Bacteroidota bacterium]